MHYAYFRLPCKFAERALPVSGRLGPWPKDVGRRFVHNDPPTRPCITPARPLITPFLGLLGCSSNVIGATNDRSRQLRMWAGVQCQRSESQPGCWITLVSSRHPTRADNVSCVLNPLLLPSLSSWLVHRKAESQPGNETDGRTKTGLETQTRKSKTC